MKAPDLEWNKTEWDISPVSVAIRKWDDNLRDDLEFRCFVYGSRLRAISQYNHYCYFKHLGDDPEFVDCIKSKIEHFFENEIRERVDCTEYVVDIGIVILNEMNKYNVNALDCMVIELNPFRTTTGAALFNWSHDADQLKKGQNVEVRVHHKTVITDEFVNHYTEESDNAATEKTWLQLVDEIEHELQPTDQKTKCVLL